MYIPLEILLNSICYKRARLPWEAFTDNDATTSTKF